MTAVKSLRLLRAKLRTLSAPTLRASALCAVLLLLVLLRSPSTVLVAPSAPLAFAYEVPANVSLDYLAAVRGVSACTGGYHGVEVLSHAGVVEMGARAEDAEVVLVPIASACWMREGGAGVELGGGLAFPRVAAVRGRAKSVFKEIVRAGVWEQLREKVHVVVAAQGFGRLLLSESGEFETGDGIVLQNSVLWSANGELGDAAVRLEQGDVVVPVHVGAKRPRVRPTGHRRPVLASFSGKVHYDYHRHSRGMRQFFLRFVTQRPKLAKKIRFRKTSATKGWVNVHKVMAESKFCLAFEGWWSWTPRITEAVISGCVPVLISVTQMPPLYRSLPFHSYGLMVHPRDLRRLPQMLDDAVKSGLYSRLATGLAAVQPAYDWLPPHGRALEMALNETVIGRADTTAPSPPALSESKHSANGETALGVHYASMQQSSSVAVQRIIDTHADIFGRVTLCIRATFDDDAPKKGEPFRSPALDAIKYYLDTPFEKLLHSIVVITTKRERTPFTGYQRVKVHSFDTVTPSTFLRQCARAAETDMVLLADSEQRRVLKIEDFKRQVEAWKKQPDRIIGREPLSVSGLPGQYHAVALDGALVHKMWLLTASITAGLAPGAFNSSDCAAVALGAMSFSVSQIHPLVLSETEPKVRDVDVHDCLSHLNMNVLDVFLPVTPTETTPRESETGDLDPKKHLAIRSIMGIEKFKNDSEAEPSASRDMCVCESDTVEDFVNSRCGCSCVNSEERTALASRARTSVKGTVLIMSARSDGARGRILSETIDRYLREPEYQKLIETVVLVWNGVGANSTEPPTIAQSFKDSGKYVELIQKANSLNNRWLTSESYLPTEAVIVQDDDIIAKPEAMALLLQRWEEQNKERWVTAFVRSHSVGETDGVMRYSMAEAVSEYSIGIPRFSVLHRKYLEAYQSAGEEAHFHVDNQVAHCDDVLMSVAITASAGQSPLRVELQPAALFDVGSWDPGLTDEAKGNRRVQRSQCLRYLANDIFKLDNKLPVITETARLSELRASQRPECPVADSVSRFHLRESVHDAWEICGGDAPGPDEWTEKLCELVRKEPRLPAAWLTEDRVPAVEYYT